MYHFLPHFHHTTRHHILIVVFYLGLNYNILMYALRKENIMANFNWNPQSALFYLHKIENKVNADILFASLLLEIERNNIDPSKIFTVKEISELIPIGTADITHPSTYGFSITSMFSTQKNRDYFIFENNNIPDELRAVSNNKKRNNYYWKKCYLNEKVNINSKYIKF